MLRDKVGDVSPVGREALAIVDWIGDGLVADPLGGIEMAVHDFYLESVAREIDFRWVSLVRAILFQSEKI